MIQSQPGYAYRRKEKTLKKELTAIRRQKKNERKPSGEQKQESVQQFVKESCSDVIF